MDMSCRMPQHSSSINSPAKSCSSPIMEGRGALPKVLSLFQFRDLWLAQFIMSKELGWASNPVGIQVIVEPKPGLNTNHLKLTHYMLYTFSKAPDLMLFFPVEVHSKAFFLEVLMVSATTFLLPRHLIYGPVQNNCWIFCLRVKTTWNM